MTGPQGRCKTSRSRSTGTAFGRVSWWVCDQASSGCERIGLLPKSWLHVTLFCRDGYLGFVHCMTVRDFLRNNWPAIAITLTATAIAGAAIVMLRGMPPRGIVMATGPEGGAYHEFA